MSERDVQALQDDIEALAGRTASLIRLVWVALVGAFLAGGWVVSLEARSNANAAAINRVERQIDDDGTRWHGVYERLSAIETGVVGLQESMRYLRDRNSSGGGR